jgi:serine/threonine protein kinase
MLRIPINEKYQQIVSEYGYNIVLRIEQECLLVKNGGRFFYIKIVPVLRIKSEIIAMNELSHINGVVKLAEHFIFDNYVFIVSHCAHGSTLEFLINNNLLTTKSKKKILTCLRSIIKNIHQAGWIHGDINSQNIIIGLDHHVTLIDFGSSLKITDNTQIVIDTDQIVPYSPAPEAVFFTESQAGIFDNYKMDTKADFWSFGRVISEMFNFSCPGASVFYVEDMPVKMVIEIYKPYQSQSGIPKCIDRLLINLFELDPLKRRL